MLPTMVERKSPIGRGRDVNTSGVDLSPRGIHIPSRTSSRPYRPHRRIASPSRQRRDLSPSVGGSTEDRAVASSAASMASYDSPPSSVEPGALYDRGPSEAHEKLHPLTEDNPDSFDLLSPDANLRSSKSYSLEERSELMFSRKHLQAIFQDPHQLHRFTAFLTSSRPKSIPLLIYYLDALKALRAINYANAVAEALDPIENLAFTEHAARPTMNGVLEEKASAAFDVLVCEDLPAFITHVYIKIASRAITQRVTGNLPKGSQEAEGLAEVFCFTDVSRPDNPIIFASEEFHRTTQYGVNYAIGRNCRFLQGPCTNRDSIRRVRTAVETGQEISEVFLNYRRDGSPFMNMLMMAPLYDSRGTLRYFIGAQIDISGLVKECVDLEALQKIVATKDKDAPPQDPEPTKDEFQELAEMLNYAELDCVRKHGGRMHRDDEYESENETRHRIGRDRRPRMHLRDSADSADERTKAESIPKTINGRLQGVYQHYLLLRPAPSLRILFTSPSLRIPGILQSPFVDRIGGSARVRAGLTAALSEGQGVTAKVKWLTNPRNSDEEGRTRWIHATPLLDANGKVGVWMVLLVDEATEQYVQRRKFRVAPPVEQFSSQSYHHEDVETTARPSTRNVPETDSIVMRSVPTSGRHSTDDEGPHGKFLEDDEYDSAPGPQVRNVARKQPRVIMNSISGGPGPGSYQQRQQQHHYQNGLNSHPTPSRPSSRNSRQDRSRANSSLPPPSPAVNHVRISSPAITPPQSPKDKRNFIKLGMSQAANMIGRRSNGQANGHDARDSHDSHDVSGNAIGNGSVDSVAL
ncbi:hypothetical protein EJ05DRAFT_67178 [Pseudovirgaria hyperparasitica]|uniref:PAC domain-containing protein n=1 Tax=Pseudovirgaria hyperparasitica TaxID=470096 RepID=A0A6A6W1V8_9PEZI|nr:uncharacterized protein EJ05DRAFT_67178 [Pseudovirgaria hyperparasitica]KAF2756535.1 hypothetical protein EJ05DRAFT_67178 [Pseudovirgaria hyperparasitica]